MERACRKLYRTFVPMATTILIVDDEEKLRKLLTRIVSLEGYQVLEAGSLSGGRHLLAKESIDILLCDVKLPDGSGVDFTKEVKEKYPHIEIVLITAYGNIPDGVQAMRNGAFDYIVKGDDNDKIIPLLAQAAYQISREPRIRRNTGYASVISLNNIISESDAMHQAILLAQKVAPSDTAVLLTGETGTGKEVFAQAIHRSSRRAGGPFVAINCSAFGKELLESELFGHKSGAFTGAVKDKTGLIDEAAGGTLFLDEIGEMTPDLQPKLLRFLEAGTYYPVGDTKQRTADVRIIAATNRDLQQEVERGTFRTDFYYRIAVFRIELPPLRERLKDIPVLAEQLIALAASRAGRKVKGISNEALHLLQKHSWKGNIRELKNVLERAMILEDSACISVDSLPVELTSGNAGPSSLFDMAAMEKAHIAKVLKATGGNKAEAARLLNIGIATLYRKVEEYGFKKGTEQ